jgi:hypothetical protein
VVCCFNEGNQVFEKRILQLLVALGGFVPVGAGLAGIIMGPAMVPSGHLAAVPLDSHFRYLSGLLLGIGLCFWSTIPSIERMGARFRLLTLIVLIGGLSRLVSLYAVGVPDHPMLFGLFMELVVTPSIAFLQYRVEKLSVRPHVTVH